MPPHQAAMAPLLNSPQTPASGSSVHPVDAPFFREVGLEAGLNYRWSITGKRPLNILQTIGNGCAFLDYDRDRCLDILLVGAKLGLFKGDGKGHFTDVTRQTGLDRLSGHFLGCAVGDYDNDGYDDLYISGYRTGLLLHNEAGSGFRDVTHEAGIPPQGWGSSCGFADLGGDGYLDLYIANYVQFDPRKDLVLCEEKGVLTGCGPRDYTPAIGKLYRNVNGKRFDDVTSKWGVKGHGRGLGVAFADFRGAGPISLAVANDLLDGDLFESNGRGRFTNVGEAAGIARDKSETHAGMGIDWGDYDNDGLPDLFVTTFSQETKCLYRNHGDGLFTEVSAESGVEAPTLPYVSWGCKFFDADNDGWLDLLIASGHVEDNIRQLEKENYRQPTVFLHNSGSRPVRFADASRTAGIGSLPSIVGRGVAVGDYDNDGRVDALIVDSEGRPLLLHNETQTTRNWIGFRLIGNRWNNRDAYGSVVTIRTTSQRLVRQCQPSGSYLSSSDSRVHFGLGTDKIASVTIRWPDRTAQTWTGLEPNRYYTVCQGSRPE